jgi:hypothetical protein
MGLKGYRLWDMGQMNATCRAPPRHGYAPRLDAAVAVHALFHGNLRQDVRHQVVAVQVVFEKAKFETTFAHFIGAGVGTRRFRALWRSTAFNVYSPTKLYLPGMFTAPSTATVHVSAAR